MRSFPLPAARRPVLAALAVAWGLAAACGPAAAEDAPLLPALPAGAVPTDAAAETPAADGGIPAERPLLDGAPVGDDLPLFTHLGPDPPRYFVFDALGLQRDYHVPDGPLVVENVTPAFPALQTNMLQSTVGPGVRLLYGQYACDSPGWEVGYLGVWNMYAVSRVESPGSLLQAPGALGFASPAMRNAAAGSFSGVTALQSADVNAVFHTFDGGRDPLSPRPSQRVAWYDGGHIDLLGGFRWAALDDAAVLGLTPAGAPGPNTYATRATTNMFAGQLGIRGRMNFQEWALESWIKCGLAGTSIDQSQSFSDLAAPADPYRPAGSAYRAGMGLVADANLSAIWRMNDVWGVRVGYNLVWLAGVALAPAQFDWSASTTPPTTIHNDGSMLLSGANAGLEARW